MHTVSVPPDPWGPVQAAPGVYAPTRLQGKRVPGWEDVNITQLAAAVGVSFRYLLGVLCGQRNCTLALLQHTSKALGIELTALIDRMERAYQLRILEAAGHTDKKGERRRMRSHKRALQATDTSELG